MAFDDDINTCTPINTSNTLLEFKPINTNKILQRIPIELVLIFKKLPSFSNNLSVNLYFNKHSINNTMNLCKFQHKLTNNDFISYRFLCPKPFIGGFKAHAEIYMPIKNDRGKISICELTFI